MSTNDDQPTQGVVISAVASALTDAKTAYRRRNQQTSVPLLVPKWSVDLWGHDAVDAEARRLGFDGYELYEQ
jgi:hypothetical protein